MQLGVSENEEKDLKLSLTTGMCLVAAGHPLDLIKVNLQTMPTPKPGEKPVYTGMMDCARKIIAKDGLTGLYRGMSAPLVGITPIYAICFWGYKQGDNIAVGPALRHGKLLLATKSDGSLPLAQRSDGGRRNLTLSLSP